MLVYQRVVLTEYHELGDLHLQRLGTISFDPSLSCEFPEAAKSGNIQTCLVSPLNGTEPVLYNMIYIYIYVGKPPFYIWCP